MNNLSEVLSIQEDAGSWPRLLMIIASAPEMMQVSYLDSLLAC